MACTDKEIFNLEYCAAEESKFAGFNRRLHVARPSHITTWPTFNAAAAVGEPAHMSNIKTTGAFAFASGKCFKTLDAFVEGIGAEVKSAGNTFASEITVQIQNTPQNRSWIYNEVGAELAVIATEPDESYGNLFGRPGFPAKIKRDSVNIVFGKEFADTEMIEFVIESKPFGPAIYSGAIPTTPAT